MEENRIAPDALNALYEITHPKKKTFKQKIKDFFKNLWYATTGNQWKTKTFKSQKKLNKFIQKITAQEEPARTTEPPAGNGMKYRRDPRDRPARRNGKTISSDSTAAKGINPQKLRKQRGQLIDFCRGFR